MTASTPWRVACDAATIAGMTDSHYSDPRLVALYDALNPFADDTRFYLDLAARTQASRVEGRAPGRWNGSKATPCSLAR